MTMTVEFDNKVTASGEIMLEVEELEAVIAPCDLLSGGSKPDTNGNPK